MCFDINENAYYSPVKNAHAHAREAVCRSFHAWNSLRMKVDGNDISLGEHKTTSLVERLVSCGWPCRTNQLGFVGHRFGQRHRRANTWYSEQKGSNCLETIRFNMDTLVDFLFALWTGIHFLVRWISFLLPEKEMQRLDPDEFLEERGWSNLSCHGYGLVSRISSDGSPTTPSIWKLQPVTSHPQSGHFILSPLRFEVTSQTSLSS